MKVQTIINRLKEILETAELCVGIKQSSREYDLLVFQIQTLIKEHEKQTESDYNSYYQDNLLLEILIQSCGVANKKIDNRCISIFEDVCERLAQHKVLTKVNGRIYKISRILKSFKQKK